MPDRSELEALLGRVENASGFDRELDRDIGLAIGGWRMEEQPPHGLMLYVPEDETYYVDAPGGMYPALTDSVDAALALVERCLPGAIVTLEGPAWCAVVWSGALTTKEQRGEAKWFDGAPLALLAALLKALLASHPAEPLKVMPT